MPIDLRLLRSDETLENVRRWYLLRTSSPSAEGHKKQPAASANTAREEDPIGLAIGLDGRHREAQKRLAQYKSSCRQERKRPDSETLQSYQKQCEELSCSLRAALWSIGNAVDETLQQDNRSMTIDEGKKKERSVNNLLQSPCCRLLEVGALEWIGDLENLSGDSRSGLLCWTNIGLEWSHALSRYLSASLLDMSMNAKQTKNLQLPECLPIEESLAHDMLGCLFREQGKHCPICFQSRLSSTKTTSSIPASIKAPSWLAYLKLKYAEQTLGDKQLPRVLHYSTIDHQSYTSPYLPGLAPSSEQRGAEFGFLDPREQARKSSFFKYPFPSIPTSTVHHVLILTSATLADSRDAQQEWIEKLAGFYQSLINLEMNDDNKRTPEEMIRQKVVGPSDLLPGEASRLVLEGFLPLHDSSSKEKDKTDEEYWVILAYISSFLDYPSRACRIKNNQHQFCHVLQGTLCSIPETMAWQAENNDHETSEKHNEIRICKELTRYFAADSDEINGECTTKLPRIMSLGKTKQGKLQIQPMQIPLKVKKSSETVKRIRSRTSSIPTTLENIHPTREQIQLEALSSPFEFLPFYSS